MKSRAYSWLEIKAVDDEQWVIEGIASTPTPDRYGDIVEPLGAQFTLPMPLLWQHNASKPVGEVTFAKATKTGIPFQAKIRKASEFTAETLRERALEAWESVKTGLVKAVSIGFRSVEHSYMENGGIHFQAWEWMELSLVTIPANAEATIQTIKQYDDPQAASGRVVRLTSPGASGGTKSTKPKPRGGEMTITERIAAFEATRASKAARMAEITEKAGDEGRTKDAAEQEEFDTLRDEIKSIDRELGDLRDMEKLNAAQAKPVNGGSIAGAADARGAQVVVKAPAKLEPGIEFARFAMCMAAAKGNVVQALDLAETHYPQQVRAVSVLKAASKMGGSVEKLITNIKNAVAGGTTTDETWAAPLVQYNQFAGDFVEFLRPRTILGQFGTGGVPSLNQIPFNVHIRGQTSGGTGYWVGEGKPKPVTKFDFNDTYHGYAKVAAISVITEELIRFSDPSAERLVRDGLAGALIATLDTDFVDPSKVVASGVSPASITNGVVAIAASGIDGNAVRADIADLWAAALAANLPLTSAVYITTPSIALALSLMMNPLGQREFPDITMTGGRLLGVPTIVSNYVPAGTFILVFASEIWLSDDGMVTIDASREASIEMLDNPTNASADGTATSVVSMYQTDSVALRAHRFINWSKRRATAVALLDGVGWGGAVSS